MTDLDMIRELKPQVPLPDRADLSPARGRLAAAIAAERGSRPPASTGLRLPASTGLRPPASTGLRLRRRLFLTGVGALAAGVAAVLVLVTAPGSRPARVAPAVVGAAVPAESPAPLPAPVVGVNPAAAHIFHEAALAALRLPSGAPRPDQFVYTKSVQGVTKAEQASGDYQLWLSVDGTRDGLKRSGGRNTVLPGCRDGQQRVREQGGGPLVPQACAPDPAFQAGLPTSPHALLSYLTKVWGGQWGGGTPDGLNRLGKAVNEMLTDDYLLPAQRAALYELLAQTPGFTVVRHAADVSGRHGVGVSWPFIDGSKTMIIFDSSTYAELGLTTWGSGKYSGDEGGSALLKVAIVNKAGQLP